MKDIEEEEEPLGAENTKGEGEGQTHSGAKDTKESARDEDSWKA